MINTAAPNPAVEDIEQQLKLSLRKIDPNPQFIDHLHNRLASPSQLRIERRRFIGIELILAAASLFTGIVLIWALRMVFADTK